MSSVAHLGLGPVSTIRDLERNKLTEQVALQIGRFTAEGEPTLEVEVVDHGTVTLPAPTVNADETVPMGYNTKLYINRLPDESTPGETWAPRTNGSHQVFANKPAGVGPGELMDAPGTLGIVKAAQLRLLGLRCTGFLREWDISWDVGCDEVQARNSFALTWGAQVSAHTL